MLNLFQYLFAKIYPDPESLGQHDDSPKTLLTEKLTIDFST